MEDGPTDINILHNLLDCFLGWVNEARQQNGQQHIAIDGKTLRRSHAGEQRPALHLLSAMMVESGLPMGGDKLFPLIAPGLLFVSVIAL